MARLRWRARPTQTFSCSSLLLEPSSILDRVLSRHSIRSTSRYSLYGVCEVPKYYSSTGASSFLAPISLLSSPLLSSPSFAYHKVHIQGSLNFSGSTSTDANFFSILLVVILQSNHGPSSLSSAAHSTPCSIAIAQRARH